MKSVLISIQPKWVELIANGKKTIEVRKTKPKLKTPFKVYIYCTIDGGVKGDMLVRSKLICGKVIGEFVCDSIEALTERDLFEGMDEMSNSRIEEYSCLSIDELLQYKGSKSEIYGWHISDLVIYDKPRELSEFAKPAKTAYDNEGYLLCDGCEFANWNIERVCTIDFCPERMITRPPQSWGYVESEDTE
jgi:predicted transcriptional regulator